MCTPKLLSILYVNWNAHVPRLPYSSQIAMNKVKLFICVYMCISSFRLLLNWHYVFLIFILRILGFISTLTNKFGKRQRTVREIVEKKMGNLCLCSDFSVEKSFNLLFVMPFN